MGTAVIFFLVLGAIGFVLHASVPRSSSRPRPAARPAQSKRAKRPAPYRPASTPRRLKGKCWVIDGDTIIVEKTKIRLAGIDAPELDQPYGKKAKWAMHSLCKGQVIIVELTGEASHDRLVGTCYLPDGRDLAAELVKLGLALDWALFSNQKYRHLEPQGARKRILHSRHLAEMRAYQERSAPRIPQPSHRS